MHQCLPDKVDDPPLGLLGAHVELLREHRDADALVDPAEGLEDHHPRVLDEVVQTGHQEEVVHEHGLAVAQLLLGPVEIEVDIEVLKNQGLEIKYWD